MMELYKKYVHYIVGILLALLCGKSCQSCSSERARMWDQQIYNEKIDSLCEIQDSLNAVILDKKDTIIYYKYQLQKANSILERTETTNNHLRRSNQKLLDAQINKE